VVVIYLKPLTSSVFRGPAGVFQAGLHGPAATSLSLTYPLPSTIAGLIAGLAWRMGLCNPAAPDVGVSDFGDQERCVRAILGEGYYLRPGLAVAGGHYYAYTGSGRLIELGELKRYMESCGIPPECPEKTLEPPRLARAGVALDRASKRAATGFLYSQEEVDYSALGASLAVLAGPGWVPGARGITAPLGGEQRAAIITVEDAVDPAELLVEGEGPRWRAILLTPALLHKAPAGGAVRADTSLAGEVARLLYEESDGEVRNCIEASSLEIHEIPRGELVLSIAYTGVSLAATASKPGHHVVYRSPHVIVPPGTTLTIKAPRNCAEKIARLGIGAHSRLGWGTLLLTSEECSKP